MVMSRFSIDKENEKGKLLITYKTDRMIAKKAEVKSVDDLEPLVLRLGDIYYHPYYNKTYLININSYERLLGYFYFSLLHKNQSFMYKEEDEFEFTDSNNVNNFLKEKIVNIKNGTIRKDVDVIDGVFYKKFIYVGNIYIDDYETILMSMDNLPLEPQERKTFLESDILYKYLLGDMNKKVIEKLTLYLNKIYFNSLGIELLDAEDKKNRQHHVRDFKFKSMDDKSLHPHLLFDVKGKVFSENNGLESMIMIEGYHQSIFFDEINSNNFNKYNDANSFKYIEGIMIALDEFAAPSVYVLADNKKIIIPMSVKEKTLEFPFTRKYLNGHSFDKEIKPNLNNPDFIYHIGHLI